jgi:hypothetical protein
VLTYSWMLRDRVVMDSSTGMPLNKPELIIPRYYTERLLIFSCGRPFSL